jgi:hypothetical protein
MASLDQPRCGTRDGFKGMVVVLADQEFAGARRIGNGVQGLDQGLLTLPMPLIDEFSVAFMDMT